MASVAEAFLADADPSAPDEPIPLGREGKPFFAPNPTDDWKPVFDKLKRKLGEDGFNCVLPVNGPDDFM